MNSYSKNRLIIFGSGDVDSTTQGALTDITIEDNNEVNSSSFSGYKNYQGILYISIDKTGDPDLPALTIEFSPNQGVDWYALSANPFASIGFGKNAYSFNLPGSLFRFKLAPVNCDSSNTLIINAWAILNEDR
jgi:hypothetical protein